MSPDFQRQLYSHTNYRSFLKVLMDEKLQNKRLSYRYFSKKAAINSPNYFQAVIEGRRNLRPETAVRMAKALQLKGHPRKYFLGLVDLQNAKEGSEKMKILEDLKRIVQEGSKKQVQDQSFHSSWLHAVIWELALIPNFDFSLAKVRDRLGGIATQTEIKDSLEYLLSKQYLLKTEVAHVYRQNPVFFSPENDVKNLEIQKCHLKFLELAQQKLSDSVDQREYQGLTIAVSKKKIPELKQRIRNFIHELNDEFSNALEADELLRIEGILFRLTGDQ